MFISQPPTPTHGTLAYEPQICSVWRRCEHFCKWAQWEDWPLSAIGQCSG